MQKSTLLELVRSLNKKEIRELHKWLMSPAHNQRQDVQLLFEYLSKLDDARYELLEKEKAWKGIFPKQPYDDDFMRQVMYFLTKAIEDYFIFKEHTKDEIRPLLSLAGLYRTRRLEKPFRQTIEVIKRKLEASPIRNNEYHLHKFYQEQEVSFYLFDQDNMRDVNLQQVSDEFDTAFVANKLRIACEMLAHQTRYRKAHYVVGLLEPILAEVEKGTMLQKPGVAVYYYGYKALTDSKNEDHFNKLEQILQSNWNAFPAPEQKELYLLAINYCIPRINAGDLNYTKKAHELQRAGLKLGVLMENDSVTRVTFGNVVSSATKVGEFEWAEDFIKKYQVYLDEKIRHSTVQFNLARLYYEKGDSSKAQLLLRDFEYDDMMLNAIAKTLLLKIYYEKGEYDALESLLDSLRAYLNRKEAFSNTSKLIFKNTIKVMKQLSNLNLYAASQVEKFRALVMETNPLHEREWFLRQIDPTKRKKL